MLGSSANTNQENNENSTLLTATTKLSNLNVNAVEFIPSFTLKNSSITSVTTENTVKDELDVKQVTMKQGERINNLSTEDNERKFRSFFLKV